MCTSCWFRKAVRRSAENMFKLCRGCGHKVNPGADVAAYQAVVAAHAYRH
jgi:ribosomal protein L37AE/L43A